MGQMRASEWDGRRSGGAGDPMSMDPARRTIFDWLPCAGVWCPGDQIYEGAGKQAPARDVCCAGQSMPCEPSVHFDVCWGREEIEYLLEETEREETFSQALLRLIRERRFEEPELYNSVFMDRKLFNKIRNSPDYQPSKRTALLLALALKLDVEETEAFIGRAGFCLSRTHKLDVIVEHFISSGNYNVLEINEVLEEHKIPLLFRCK